MVASYLPPLPGKGSLPGGHTDTHPAPHDDVTIPDLLQHQILPRSQDLTKEIVVRREACTPPLQFVDSEVTLHC